jgi:histidine triad (HIT) family protein
MLEILHILLAILIALMLIAVIEQQRPVSKIIFPLLTNTLKTIREKSLAAPQSPFEKTPTSLWIAESDNAYAIKDIRPREPHHYLIIPKQRIYTMLDAEAELLGEMLILARQVAKQRGIAEDGFRIVINTNPHGLQTVYHLHIHVLGGRQLRLPVS